jgi:hypothetical protein
LAAFQDSRSERSGRKIDFVAWYVKGKEVRYKEEGSERMRYGMKPIRRARLDGRIVGDVLALIVVLWREMI